VSCLAEVPSLIKRLFLHDGSKSEFGIHRIKIFHKGLVEHVTIDDYIPCCVETNKPLFSFNQDESLWLPFLEKAFAKLYKSYKSLEIATVQDYLYDLTGWPTETLEFSESSLRSLIENNKLYELATELEDKGCLLSF
jgi:Calpain family cysteine protease